MTAPISDIMETEFASLEAGQSLFDVIDMVMRCNETHIFVTKDGKLIGLVSKTNLCERLMQMIKKSSGHLVMEIEMKATLLDLVMTENVKYLTAQMSVQEASDLFIQNKLRCCPVIDETGRPIGKITAIGLLKEYQTSNFIEI